MWQALFVRSELEKLHPDRLFVVEGVATIGDQDQNTPLSQFTIKGVFTKELDVAQLQGQVDLVVHCVKDLPTTLVEGLSTFASWYSPFGICHFFSFAGPTCAD